MLTRKAISAGMMTLALIAVAIGKLTLSGVSSEGASANLAEPPARIRVTNVVTLRERVGATVTVVGRVDRTNASNSGHQFLNFRDTELAVICRSADVSRFAAGGPAKIYRGKDVEITGKLELYRGKLQIQLRTPDQIRITESTKENRTSVAVELKQVGQGTWKSPLGLVYQGRDPEGLTRVAHIERHVRDIPNRDGPHGVFDGGSAVAFGVIDEAWQIAQRQRLKPRNEGKRSLYDVPMGRRIGFLGGQVGSRRSHPPLSRVRIVFETGTKNIVTAFPR